VVDRLWDTLNERLKISPLFNGFIQKLVLFDRIRPVQGKKNAWQETGTYRPGTN
jgi:hypothetical protein